MSPQELPVATFPLQLVTGVIDSLCPVDPRPRY